MTPEMFRSPPKDLYAEASLVASVLWSDEFLCDVVAMVPDESAFHLDAHAKLWRIILDFHADGRKIDGVTVGTECDRRGVRFEGSGSSEFVLQVLRDHPINENAVDYARSVVRCARLRKVIEVADGMQRDAYGNQDEPDAVLGRAMDLLRGEESRSDADVVPAGSLIPAVLKALDARANNRLTGVMTPWEGVNRLSGGLQTQDLVIVAARTSMGKTSFALNLAAFAAMDNGVPTMVVSLEMDNALLVERILAFRSNTHTMSLRTGRLTPTQSERFVRAQYDLNNSPLHFAYRPGRTLRKIVSTVRRAKARMGLGMVVIDYIQQINAGGGKSLYESTTAAAKELKDLANDLQVPVVALSQLSRTVTTRDDRRPKMTDLRDSGAIEEAADLVILLHRPDYYDPNDNPGVAELTVAKNRNGPPGDVRLTFHKETMLFETENDVVPISAFGRPPS